MSEKPKVQEIQIIYHATTRWPLSASMTLDGPSPLCLALKLHTFSQFKRLGSPLIYICSFRRVFARSTRPNLKNQTFSEPPTRGGGLPKIGI